MGKYFQAAFWIIIFIALSLAFGRSYGGYAQSFYFVSFLFPVILGTSVFFNSYLVPKYLLRKKYFRFFQYSLYTLVFSVYFEILVLTLSLAVFANYRYDQLNPKTTDLVFLTMIMYFLVFVNTILLLLQEYFRGQDKNREMEKEQERLKRGCLIITSERKHVSIPYGTLVYMESVGNYVKIHLASGKPLMTKERISILEEELPGSFLRIHRSILVNREWVSSFNRESVYIHDLELPISRKYKEAAMKWLGSA